MRKKVKLYKTPEITDLKDMLDKSVTRYPKRTAFKLKNENGEIYNLTYKDFYNDIKALTTYFINSGLANKKIAVIGVNSYKWAIAYFAATIAGVVVPIDKELHTDDVINFLNSSESSMIVSDDKNLKDILNRKNEIINKNLTYISIDSKENTGLDFLKQEGYRLVENGDSRFDEIKVDPDEMKILIFTSGTTGKSKGVCLSHKNICSNIMSTCKTVKVKSKDTLISILPLHHTYECTIGFLLPIYRGACITYCDGLKHISKNITEYRPSIVVCVPLLLENMHKKIIKNIVDNLGEKYKDIKGHILDAVNPVVRKVIKNKVKNSLGGFLRLFIVGAAAIEPEIVKSFFKLGIKTLQGYGLTECSPLLVGNTDYVYNYASAGLTIPDVECTIYEPNDEGIGEIIARGPNIMLGYYKDEEATNKVIKNGWFHTGDLGKFDNKGFLYITGRIKNVIVTKNGKNIYPEEVEYYLNNNPLIAESLVIGSTKENNDETYVNAQIFPNIDAIKEYLKVTIPTKEEIHGVINDIISEVNKRLPNYKHIKWFKIRDKEFEKTTTKKIKRFGNNLK